MVFFAKAIERVVFPYSSIIQPYNETDIMCAHDTILLSQKSGTAVQNLFYCKLHIRGCNRRITCSNGFLGLGSVRVHTLAMSRELLVWRRPALVPE